MNYNTIQTQDPEIYELIKKEEIRQKEGLELIPSENYTSKAVLEANGSIFTNKYSEGYPGKRYYGGNFIVDQLETLCQKRAQEVFGAGEYRVNVQPYSGSPANIAVYNALLEFGDTVLSLELAQGGHLTHGSPVNFSGRAFNFIHYPLNPETEQIDYEVVEKLALEHKPKIILSGFTAYPRKIDFAKFHEIAKKVGAISMADISHISGLIAGEVHVSPFPFTDIVTTTTHKTLRGPRAAMIFSKSEFADKIDKAIFPGSQGGPHEHTIAGIAVALKEAKEESFKTYAEQIVKNTQVLAESLASDEIKLVSGGSDNHLLLVDLRAYGPSKGIFIEKALDAAHITVNKNTVPGDTASPFYPSGIRLGTPALTTRGMKESEMQVVGKLISRIIKEFATTELPDDKTVRMEKIKSFENLLLSHETILGVKKEVIELTKNFPVPGIE